jgi:membrane associated rhomboid family serine protease
MIPLKDDNPRSTFPFVTILLIIANVAVFVHQFLLPRGEVQQFINQYAAIPYLISGGQHLHSPFTSMFLHGGLMHVGGNMLYLWIFGDNVEHICGHVRFLAFYFVCGLVAFTSHYLTSPFSEVPMVGASGAISGVLGAYILRFPRAKIFVLFPLFIWIWRMFSVPAFIVLGFWILVQLANGLYFSSASGGVAWFAHIGGFFAGLLLIKLFEKKKYRLKY